MKSEVGNVKSEVRNLESEVGTMKCKVAMCEVFIAIRFHHRFKFFLII